MKASDSLLKTWELVRVEAHKTPGYYHRRVPIDSAFPAYAGIVYPEASYRLSLLAENEAICGVSLCDKTKGYTVDIEPMAAGHPQTSFVHITARGAATGELFTILAADILDQWAHQELAKSAVASIHRRLQHWRRFFQRGGAGLSQEEHIGLYAELMFLEVLLDTGMEPDSAVYAWQGPLGTNQDFLFGSRAVEVKGSTGNDPETVRIANERQLDSLGLKSLFLFHLAFDFREGAGRTLEQLVSALTERLRISSPSALILFGERLLNAGYMAQITSPYDSHGFTERKRTAYNVTDGFPRITESCLPAGVTAVSYQLNLALCSTYQVQTGKVTQAVRTGA